MGQSIPDLRVLKVDVGTSEDGTADWLTSLLRVSRGLGMSFLLILCAEEWSLTII
jgi:hypothetical protein